MADENKFIGKHYELETTTEYVKKPPYQLEFYAYEQQGLTALRRKRCWPDFWRSKLVPINRKEDLRPGDTIYFPHPFTNGFWEVVVDEKREYAESGDLYVSLVFNTDMVKHGFPPVWVGSGFMNKKGLERIEFA